MLSWTGDLNKFAIILWAETRLLNHPDWLDVKSLTNIKDQYAVSPHHIWQNLIVTRLFHSFFAQL